MNRHRLATQFFKYAIVGGTSNLILYVSYLCLTWLGVGHKTSMTSLYLLGTVVTFVANKYWTFGYLHSDNRAVARYVTAYFFGYLLNFLLLWIAVDHWHLPHQWVQLVAVFLVAGSLFVIQRHWVFPSSPACQNTT